MFQTIIVGIDGRPQAAQAVSLARQLAEPGAEIIVAKVAVMAHDLLRDATVPLKAEAIDAAEAVVDAFTDERGATESLAIGAPSVGRGLADLARAGTPV